MIIQFCGLSGVGKTTLAHEAKSQLFLNGISVEIVDGDIYRSKICKDLGFSKADRQENIRRLGFIASRFSSHGIVAIMSVINPYNETRAELKATYRNVKTVFLDCSVETLFIRDTKGLYRRSQLPEQDPEKISNLSGVNDQFDIPLEADLYLNTDLQTIEACTADLCRFIIHELKLLNPEIQFPNIRMNEFDEIGKQPRISKQ